MNKLLIFLTIGLLWLQPTTKAALQEIKNVTENINSKTILNLNVTTNTIETTTTIKYFAANTTKSAITTNAPSATTTTSIPFTTTLSSTTKNVHVATEAPSQDQPTITTPIPTTTNTPTFIPTIPPNNEQDTIIITSTTSTETSPFEPYCTPSLCELFNGTHTHQVPHIACKNRGNFGPVCGSQPHLLYMSERRRNLILDLHNLARSRVASGQVAGYKSASHMPQLKWDSELEYLATLHAKRCKFAHDLCRNTKRFEFSGQNIGYFWIRRDIKSHSRRMKNFIVNWFKEYVDANQTFIDSYYPHPEGKKIGHFTLLVADRVHRVGCAAVRFREPDQLQDTKLLMTCNYDFTNILGEPIYQSGPTASKCSYKISDKYPALCDWKDAIYDYDSEESSEDSTVLDNNIDTI